MSDDRQLGRADKSSRAPDWREALDELEQSLRDANWAITLLRRALESDSDNTSHAAPPPLPASEPEQSIPASEVAPERSEGSAPSKGRAGVAAFERLWDRIEDQRQKAEETPIKGAERRGLQLLPQEYLLTVEDQEGKVDLVSLHRALNALAETEEVSLVSYASGVPVVSLRAEGDIDFGELADVLGNTMDRQCEVMPQENGKLYIRMKGHQG